jgi:hypothetical protein
VTLSVKPEVTDSDNVKPRDHVPHSTALEISHQLQLIASIGSRFVGVSCHDSPTVDAQSE